VCSELKFDMKDAAQLFKEIDRKEEGSSRTFLSSNGETADRGYQHISNGNLQRILQCVD
jgi:hypothetical protein